MEVTDKVEIKEAFLRKMNSAIFLIPIRDNRTRKLHRHAIFKEFENGLLIQFGGWTYHGLVYGCWRDDKTGKVIYDQSRKYEVGLKTKELYTLERYLKQNKLVLGQETIYMTISGRIKLL